MSSETPSDPPPEPPSAPTGPPSQPPSNPPEPGPKPEPGPEPEPELAPPRSRKQPPPAGPPPLTLVSGRPAGQRRPWWRRPRALVGAAGLVVLAGALAVALVERQPKTNQATAAAPLVTLQAVGAPGPDPFTRSVAVGSSRLPAVPAPSGAVDGGTSGLYGGTKHATSCDVGGLSAFLTSHVDKGQAWAQVEGAQPSALASYLVSLTPAVLRADTRVTNHGFADGVATSFQSVLQAGSAVLVDDHGVPRARCGCGNPLLPPVESAGAGFSGAPWASFRADALITVKPAAASLTALVMVDQDSGEWFTRPVGSTGGRDAGAATP